MRAALAVAGVASFGLAGCGGEKEPPRLTDEDGRTAQCVELWNADENLNVRRALHASAAERDTRVLVGTELDLRRQLVRTLVDEKDLCLVVPPPSVGRLVYVSDIRRVEWRGLDAAINPGWVDAQKVVVRHANAVIVGSSDESSVGRLQLRR